MKLAFALPFALLASCATAQPPPSREGPVGLGETAYVDGPTVTPLAVIEDSRCPMNARCVWAGRVVLRARIAGGSWVTERELLLGEPIPIADGALTLVSVTPETMAGQQIDPRAYRFAFAFDGGL
ncbi:MAG: hypothetical protein H7X93_00890 [Sphingomonadaceae bacterium]|nr:hypothetical protein [Sphingomonadaceae bacterium]